MYNTVTSYLDALQDGRANLGIHDLTALMWEIAKGAQNGKMAARLAELAGVKDVAEKREIRNQRVYERVLEQQTGSAPAGCARYGAGNTECDRSVCGAESVHEYGAGKVRQSTASSCSAGDEAEVRISCKRIGYSIQATMGIWRGSQGRRRQKKRRSGTALWSRKYSEGTRHC